MRAKIKFKGEEIEIPDIKKCNLFYMIKGLMFTRKKKAITVKANIKTGYKTAE